MWFSPLFWMVVAIGVFWVLGAHNRLTRLRSSVIKAFAGVDAQLVQWVALLGEIEAMAGPRGMSAAHAALHAAAPQLSASLAQARAHPLDADTLAALGVACDVARAAWRTCVDTLQEPGHSEALAPLQGRWDAQAQALAQAVDVLNVAVDFHNAAVRQFPAVLLARIWGFRPARGL